MKTFLVVLFFINGEWTLVDGWWPLEVDPSVCAQRLEMLEEQLESIDAPPFRAECVERG